MCAWQPHRERLVLADFREVVVVPRLRVCRVERLRVEDASIVPHSQPQPPTRRPVMMDEEASAMILEDARAA
jgi:choline dehydrogenase-like flavoprotein